MCGLVCAGGVSGLSGIETTHCGAELAMQRSEKMICVDQLVKYTIGGRRHIFHYACHMFADDNDLESLHHIARLMSLKREWFQDKSYPSHYDLIGKGKREMALSHGAVEVSRHYPVLIRRRKEREDESMLR